MRLTFFILLFVTIVGCQKDESSTTINQTLPFFDEVELNDAFDVYLTQDTIFNLKIEGNNIFAESVTYSVENNKLIIDNTSNKKWLHPKNNKIKLYISADSLKFVKANETCFIRTTNPIVSNEFGLVMAGKLNMAELELNCNSFYFWNNHPCGGKLFLHGKTKFLKIWNAAIMTVDAKNLIAEQALVENNSQGNCDITVNNIFEYSIGSTGDINLYGAPPQIILLKPIYSSGKLYQH